MGSAMARNLVRAGHRLSVYNRTREKVDELAAMGARAASSPAEASNDAEAVFTMLSDDDAVSDAVFGKHGIMSVLKSAAVHISSSTISTRFAKHLAQEHARKFQSMISAPVFGRPDAAEGKKLIVVAAGEATAVERCLPLFDAIGHQTFVVGFAPWQANAVKLCGNFMLASMMETFGEAFATVRKAGIDRRLFLEIMNGLFGSPVYKNYGTTIVEEAFDPAGFTLKLGLKDVRQAIEAADDLGVPMPFAGVLRDHFVSATAHGQEALDWSSIAKVAARSAGLEK